MLKFPAGPLWALVTGFAVLGGVGSVLMTRQPEFYHRWNLDNAEWGWALFATGLGGVLAYPLNRWLLARWGSRVMLHRFGTVGGIVLAAIPWLPGLPGLLAGLFAQGVIYNGVSVAINQQAAQWELQRGTRMMGRLHATFFIGSVLSACISSLLAALAVSLPLHMAAVGLAAALIHRAAAATLEAEAARSAAPVAVHHAPESWLGLGLLFCWCTVLESGVMGWASVYLNQSLKASESLSGIGLALFSGAMAVGRFLSDGLVTRHGALRIVRTGAIACAISLALAAWLHELPVALLAFTVTGLGLAAAAPVIFSIAGRMGGEALALIAGLGALGGLLGPVILGRVATYVSLDWVLATLAAVAVVIARQSAALAGNRLPVRVVSAPVH
ncbi:MFS transporter [Aromatoleum toluclasticum]|uniref:MFS transporter n=1 Tax=Aromatoleum toluclasticum TaxID=92003 RepID=UPI001D192205|nr:MFS transporter [Aromatoleum toluclasticum]MCC4117648.1 MFS transporter [Aromatoleum toluclasticum]